MIASSSTGRPSTTTSCLATGSKQEKGGGAVDKGEGRRLQGRGAVAVAADERGAEVAWLQAEVRSPAGGVRGVAGDSGRAAKLSDGFCGLCSDSAQVKHPSTYDMWAQFLFRLVPSGPAFQ